jgi:cell division protease FtsH
MTDKKPPIKQFKFDLVYVMVAVFAVLFIRDLWVGEDHTKTIPYSEFRSLLDKGEVADLVIGPTRIVGAYAKPGEAGKQHFSTVRVEPQLADDLAKRKIAFSGQPEPGLLANLVSWLLPTAGLILMWMFLLRPMTSGQGGLMGIGRSRAKIYAEQDIKVTFADVAGVDEAKQELAEVVGFLRTQNARSIGRTHT